MDVTVEMISPEIAREYLKCNKDNYRKVDHVVVRKYATDMTNGRWRQTGEPIQFDIEGKLQNGQNRLHAVIRAGITMAFIVVRGLPVAARVNMDTGKGRTLTTVLAANGEKHAGKLAAALRMLHWYPRHKEVQQNQHNMATVGACLDLLDQEPNIRWAVAQACSSSRTLKWCDRGRILLQHLTHENLPTFSDDFFNGLEDCDLLNPTDPRVVFRNIVMREAGQRPELRMVSNIMLKCGVGCWNNFLHGRETTVRYVRKQAYQTVSFPTIALDLPV